MVQFQDEQEFQDAVVALCKMMGLAVYHTHDSRRSEPGFPDLVVVGRNGTIYRELKTDTGRTSVDQTYWLAALTAAGEDARVWRPTLDWPVLITAELRALGRCPVERPLKKPR